MKAKILKIIFLFLFFPKKIFAVCPLCTIAAAGGLALAKKWGIDELIVGLWIGGLLLSLVYWAEDFFEKKKIKFKGRFFFNTLFWYFLTFFPLYLGSFLFAPESTFFFLGMFWDKILVGGVVGSFAFLAGAESYFWMKEKHGSHAYFPFQKVVMPLFPLIVLSILFYFLTK